MFPSWETECLVERLACQHSLLVQAYSKSYQMGFLQNIISNQSSSSKDNRDNALTRFGTLILSISISFPIPVLIPGITVAAKESCNAFRVDILAIYPKGSLLPSGGALLLFANHQVDFFGLDVFADMPCGKAVFVLFFSASEVANVRTL